MTDEININSSDCLVERDNIGSYECINICTGETNKIDWDFTDWACLSLITIMIIFVIVMVGSFIKDIVRK